MAIDAGTFERLKQQWHATLEHAIEELCRLHTDPAPATPWQRIPGKEGRRVPPPPDAGDTSVSSVLNDVPAAPSPSASSGASEPVAFSVMRRRLGGMDVYRAAWEEHAAAPHALRDLGAVLQHAPCTRHWLPVVEGAEVIEVLGPRTQVAKTRFKLGWPTSPRDAILLAHQVVDDDALVYVATSVPRTHDAPSYLRPAPPYIRAHVHLSAVLVRRLAPDRLAYTSYWSWDLHGSVLGIRSNAMTTYFPKSLPALAAYTQRAGPYLAQLVRYGAALQVTALGGEETTLALAYTVLEEESGEAPFGPDRDAPPRAVALGVSRACGWAVQVRAKAARGGAASWRARLVEDAHAATLVLEHEAVADAEAFVKVQVEIRATPDVDGVRVNAAVLDAEPAVRVAAALPSSARAPLLARLAAAPATPATPATPSSAAEGEVEGEVRRSGAPLAALVRRNYIYFTSLLQEPDAKWTRVSDERSVTVTQLESIDPTLVVYRAEATFVGLSVWDFFSTLSHPELARAWDEGAGLPTLVRDVGGQSLVWHTRTRGSWTTNARDAVLVQTAYKSPASIHLFAFSLAPEMLPDVPPPEAGAIRTQVDLRGWSIEALSPTTVHVTLVEQSDPGGWLSKNTLPAQMVASMAGIGEYTIQHGGPPTATRFLHARAQTWHYDTEQATYTLTYAPARDEELLDDEAVECEIRCSMEGWAPNVDIAVTPAPTHAACLHRHKLSLLGGGLWLTLEHSAAQLTSDTITLVVRKGPAQSKERNVVLLNGTRMRVDTDDLDPAQVQELARRKRTKPQRVPLDFRPAPGPERAASDGAPSDAEEAEPCAEGAAPSSDGAASLPPGASGPGGAAQTSEGALPDTAVPARRAPRHPMQPALDALFLLRRIYSERHPDPAGVPAGWSLVSERNGLYVRRKVLESLSPEVAVQRADKIVEGIAAEELMHLVANLGCRHLYDERMQNAVPLASYGSGAHTACWTARGTFPFRPRAFVVGSVRACGSQTAPLTPSGLLSPTSSRQPVYFHASASCEEASVDLARINPQQLPLGRVLIDGWILETLDPYSSASYPIPSTRATHVVAIDYGGAMPAAVNALWNAALPRALERLEQFLRQSGPAPSVCVPPAYMHVAGDGHDDDRTLVWMLQRPERFVALLASDFSAQTRTLHLLVLLPQQDALEERVEPAPLSLLACTPTSPGVARAASRGAPRRQDAPELRVLDVQLELQHYPHGYALDLTYDPAPHDGYDLAQCPATPSDAMLPLQVRVYDRPPSALQAATREAVEHSHKHLVRVVLPPAARDAPPGWYSALQTRGVAVSLRATPLHATAKPTRTGTGQVPVTVNGKVAEIVYGDEAARAAAGDAPLLDELERIARPGKAEPTTPHLLPRGWHRAVDDEVLAHPLAVHAALMPRASGEAPPPVALPAPAQAPAPAKHDAPPAPMFGLLRSNTTFHSLSSMTQLVSLANKEEDTAQPPGHLQAEHAVPTSASGYRLSTLVLVAIVSFLLGSLLRSLVQPADFVLVSSEGATVPARPASALHDPPSMLDVAAREVESLVRAARSLHMFNGRPHTPVLDGANEHLVRWREVRRFLDLRLPGRWDVVLALVRR